MLQQNEWKKKVSNLVVASTWSFATYFMYKAWEGALEWGCQGDGHQGNGYQGDGHQGNGYQGDGHQGDGHQGDGYQGDGYQAHYRVNPYSWMKG